MTYPDGFTEEYSYSFSNGRLYASQDGQIILSLPVHPSIEQTDALALFAINLAKQPITPDELEN